MLGFGRLRLLLVACLCVGQVSCRTVEWADADPLHGMAWGDRQVFLMDQDVILAVDGESAADVLDEVQVLRASLRANVGAEPGPVLWIAMGPDDSLLGDSLAEIAERLGQGEDSLGVDPDGMSGPRGNSGSAGRQEPSAEDKEQISLELLRTIASGVDPNHAGLDLPRDIRGRVQGVFLYPTRPGLERVANTVLDVAARNLSFAQGIGFRMARGMAVERMADQLTEQRSRRLLDWLVEHPEMLPPMERDGPSHRLALTQALGLPLPEEPPPVWEMSEFRALATTRFVDPDMGFSIAWSDPRGKYQNDGSVQTEVSVKARTFFDAFDGRSLSKIIMFRKGPVTRGDLNQLFDRIGDAPGNVLLLGSSHELAAAVATLFALERRAISQAKAQELWAAYGMQPLENLGFAQLRGYLGS